MLLLCVLVSVFSTQVKADAEDQQLKVVYIVNFLKFLSFTRKTDKGILVCYLADNKYSEYFSQISGVSVKGKALRVKKLGEANGINECEVLYVDAIDNDKAHALIQTAREAGVVDIGNGVEFVEDGGLIGFSVLNNRLRFSINMGQAKSRKIQFSASLLEMAHEVVH